MSSRRGDYQRSAVYRWEAEHVHPKDTDTVPFDQAQAIVDYVWARAGLTYPPKIRELARTARRTTANADRLTISIPATGASAVLVVLNGPVRRQLDASGGFNALGNSGRATAVDRACDPARADQHSRRPGGIQRQYIRILQVFSVNGVFQHSRTASSFR